ncbi:MAG: ACT domain-containing protein [Chloroflexota bacterium]
MATEFIVKLKDRPGSLAAAAQALGDAGVNLWGTAASTSAGKGTVGFVVKDKDATKARRALKKAGLRATERKAIEVRLTDKPGSLARAAAKLAKAKVNIASEYVLAPGRGNVTVAFGVKDARKAEKALGRR